MEKEQTSRYKSKQFAIRIVKLYNHLCANKKEYVLSKQLLKSGTSIGANLAEAECAMSKKEFIGKLDIAHKECAETQYWLELLHETDCLSQGEYESIVADCIELRKILTASTKTLEGKTSKDQ